MNKKEKSNVVLATILLGIFLGLTSSSLWADTEITSRFGFTVEMPDGDWFVVGPAEADRVDKGESTGTSGIHKISDQDLLNRLFEQVRSENIEFFYDGKYAGSPLKNHVSIQVSKPIILRSIDEAKQKSAEKCKSLPKEVESAFSEAPMMHSCELRPVNGRPVFHHSYTLPSPGATIINDQVPVSGRYSIMFSGTSINGVAGLRRLRAGQQALVDSITKYLNKRQLPSE